MRVLSYNTTLDFMNKAVFEKYGTDNSDEYRHKCVICERDTCIDASYSKRGERLICCSCFHKCFKKYSQAFDWIEEGEYDEHTGS